MSQIAESPQRGTFMQLNVQQGWDRGRSSFFASRSLVMIYFVAKEREVFYFPKHLKGGDYYGKPRNNKGNTAKISAN